jgi:hypothetical protein
MPIFRYFVGVGAVLLAALFAIGDSNVPPPTRVANVWTSTDSLRNMAHHSEPKGAVSARKTNLRNP